MFEFYNGNVNINYKLQVYRVKKSTNQLVQGFLLEFRSQEPGRERSTACLMVNYYISISLSKNEAAKQPPFFCELNSLFVELKKSYISTSKKIS